MNAKTVFASRKGFTLIELLVVIGILAVLAAIAIPSVAGLIDRANKSADQTNANEMTNALERFTSEYELYCQDIASGAIKDADGNGTPDDMDSAQGRVFNVTGAITRSDITALESTGLNGKQINRDTKYPVDVATIQAVVENYTKTSSSTFEPKQSDCHYFYSPDCGIIVCADANATVTELNSLVQSGKDASGNPLNDSVIWYDITNANSADNDNTVPDEEEITSEYQLRYGQPYKSVVDGEYMFVYFSENGTINVYARGSMIVGEYSQNEETVSACIEGLGEIPCNLSSDGKTFAIPTLGLSFNFSLNDRDIYIDNDYVYIYFPALDGFSVSCINKNKTSYAPIKSQINGKPLVYVVNDMFSESALTNIPEFEDGYVWDNNNGYAMGEGMFSYCQGLTNVVLDDTYTALPYCFFKGCKNLESITISSTVKATGSFVFDGCTSLKTINYLGTTADWEKYMSHDDIFDGVPAEYVTCSDGLYYINK